MSRFARLTKDQLEDIRRLEDRWGGIILLAYEKPGEPVELSSEQLKRLQALEEELGVVLVAYRKNK